jgi:hypothetical protein
MRSSHLDESDFPLSFRDGHEERNYSCSKGNATMREKAAGIADLNLARSNA